MEPIHLLYSSNIKIDIILMGLINFWNNRMLSQHKTTFIKDKRTNGKKKKLEKLFKMPRMRIANFGGYSLRRLFHSISHCVFI